MKIYVRAEQEPMYSMAQIGQNVKPPFCVWVNPDQGRKDDPYFKMYDSQKYATAKRSIRIGLVEPKIIYHADGKEIWNVTKSDMKHLDDFMSKKSRKYPGYTNWLATIYDWNYEYGSIPPAPENLCTSDIEAFFDGYYDTEENLKNPSYIPSTHEQIFYANQI